MAHQKKLKKHFKINPPEHLIYIGKKVPKGYRELGGMHLGKGIWMLSCELEKPHLKEEMR